MKTRIETAAFELLPELPRAQTDAGRVEGVLVEAQLTNRARRAVAPLTWGDRAWASWNAEDAIALAE